MGNPGQLSASSPLTRAVPGRKARELTLASPRKPGKTPRTPEAMTAKQRANLETEGVLRNARAKQTELDTPSLQEAVGRCGSRAGAAAGGGNCPDVLAVFLSIFLMLSCSHASCGWGFLSSSHLASRLKLSERNASSCSEPSESGCSEGQCIPSFEGAGK